MSSISNDDSLSKDAALLRHMSFAKFVADNAIERLIVSPFALDWYPEAVSAVLHCFSPVLAERLVASKLQEEPIL